MFQPTTTPSRSCNTDLELEVEMGDITYFGSDCNKYGLHLMPENSRRSYGVSTRYKHKDTRQNAFNALLNRLSVNACLYGKSRGKVFSVLTNRDSEGYIHRIDVLRYQ